MHLSRRSLLKSAAAVSLGFGGLHTLLSREVFGAVPSTSIPGYGPLVADPNKVMDLPKDFKYSIMTTVGRRMDDGLLVPARPDGMAAFPGADGRTILICNHENSPSDPGPFGPNNELLGNVPAEKVWDRGNGKVSAGGTTTMVFNTKTQRLERQVLSLAGTVRNCAGGPTPWGSWVTCEESVVKVSADFEKDHGYNFEVPAATATTGLVTPVPLIAMGRMNHEAIAVDPASGVVYQTEDRGDGLIYRFLPNTPGQLWKGGRLQALAVKGMPGLDTRNWPAMKDQKTGQTTPASPKTAIGVKMAVEWIDMDNVESPQDDLRYRGVAKGAALFARGEGMWYGEKAVFFACTNGGAARKGQIFRYVPSPYEGTARETEAPGTVEIFVEPNDSTLVENADNLCVAPWGDLIVVEDGPGQNRIVGVTPKGDIYQLGACTSGNSELAGACFSPDGTTLFVNIQVDGRTLAITGPWKNRAEGLAML